MTRDTAAGIATPLAGLRSLNRMTNRMTNRVASRVASCVASGPASRIAAVGAVWLTVTVATGCDKAKAISLVSTSPTAEVAPREELDLSKHPTILFEVFGERANPQMVPIGVLEGGKLRAIQLSTAGWKNFDRIYHHPGTTYNLYQDGRAVGTTTVKQGMWSKPDAPLYSLPNCQSLIPLAAVSLDSRVPAGITVEFLATSAALTHPAAASSLTPSAVASLSREIGMQLAETSHIPRARLDSLDFHAQAMTTGATPNPTLVVSYVDPNGEEAAAHGDETSYLFAIADKAGGAYTPSYARVVNGSGAHAEYRRFVDHLDLHGDGVDEIILEGWQNGGDTYLAVMRYKAGHWQEVFRGATSWCLDPKRGGTLDP
jgi:hypothetical protein